MSKGKNILVAVVLAAAGLGYIWWAAEPAPVHTQAQGQGQGGGGNQQIAAPVSTAEQADSECGALLALYQGPNLLWQRTAAEVNAMAESRPIPGGHQTKMEALELLELARLTPGNIGPAIVLSAVKLVVCVALGWAVAEYFELGKIAAGVLIVQFATPVAVTSYLLAERFGADSNAVAGMTVASTVLSILAMPVVLAFVL